MLEMAIGNSLSKDRHSHAQRESKDRPSLVYGVPGHLCTRKIWVLKQFLGTLIILLLPLVHIGILEWMISREKTLGFLIETPSLRSREIFSILFTSWDRSHI